MPLASWAMPTRDLLGPINLRRDWAGVPLTVHKAADLLVLLALEGELPRAHVVALANVELRLAPPADFMHSSRAT